MKTTASLLIALGIVMQPAMAQSSSPGYEVTSGSSSGMQSEAGKEMREDMPDMASVEPKIQGDVTYLCGGVGDQEQAYMKQQAEGYDMMLTFAARDGSYLADVDVDIRNAQGEQVLSANCDGPLMLVDLPQSGRYKVYADAAGYRLDQTVRVNARPGTQIASVVMSWPQQVAEAETSAVTSTGSSGNADESGASGSGGAR